MNLYQPTITGSLSISGSINLNGSISIAGGGTISGTASLATTASYAVVATSASHAVTASSADSFLVRNTLTAQTLVVQTITSSVDFVTGSTRFGSIGSNTHVFTGSMSVSGSGTFSGLTISNASDVYPSIQTAASDADALLGFSSTGDGNSGWGIGRRNTGEFWIANYTGNFNSGTRTVPFQITSTGAATFSSSVTADYLTANSGALINTTSAPFILYNSGGGGNAKRFALNMTNGDYMKIYSLNDNGTTRTDNIITATIGGNVGIGTSSPNHKLSIVDASYNTYSLRLESQSGNTSGRWGGIGFAGEVNNTKAGIFFVSDGTSYSRGALAFALNTATNQDNVTLGDEKMRIRSNGNVTIGAVSGNSAVLDIKPGASTSDGVILSATYTGSGSYGPFIFQTSDTERMRITSGGQVLINTSTAAGQAYNLVLRGGTGDYLIKMSSNNNTYTSDVYQDSGNGYLYFRNGSCDTYLPRTAGNWVGNSDATIKENLVKIPNALDKLSKINGYYYNLIDDKENKLVGVIAQEVNEVLPEVVHSSYSKTYDREILGVEYSTMIPLLINAIQELKAEFDEYKTTHP